MGLRVVHLARVNSLLLIIGILVGTSPYNANADYVASTIIKSNQGGNDFTYEFAHPESVTCAPPGNNNCKMEFSYRITSQNMKSYFYGNGIILNELYFMYN